LAAHQRAYRGAGDQHHHFSANSKHFRTFRSPPAFHSIAFSNPLQAKEFIREQTVIGMAGDHQSMLRGLADSRGELGGIKWASSSPKFAGVCSRIFVDHMRVAAKPLKMLVRPRGIEPLLPP
jgi:hypothetical protein